MAVSVGRKYVLDGYVADGYVEVVLISPLVTYEMFGKTTRVFPFRPNWATPPTESLEWKTDILRSRDGTEQRRSLRQQPRRGFEFSLLLQRELAAYFDSLLFDWQNRYFALPVWTDRTKLTSDAITGDTMLSVITDTYGFQPGGFALLFYSEKFFEVVAVTDVDAESVTIEDPLESDWPAGSALLPIIVGHLTASTNVIRNTSAVLQASINFLGSADTAFPNVPDSSPVTLYDGIEVITDKPNWRSGISNDVSFQFDTADAGVGPLGYYQSELVARTIRPFQWYLKSRAQIVAFRKLAGRLRGQAKSVWMPSWYDDFEIASSNASNQTFLHVKGTWFHSLIGVNTSHDRLMIRMPNGTTVYRRIIATSPNHVDDTSSLQLDSTLPGTVQPNDGSAVRLLLRCRLATDKIVIPWLTDAVSEPQTSFITVKL